MGSVIISSFGFAAIAVLAALLGNSFLGTSRFLVDVNGLSAFMTVFGTLYGIMITFVVLEVWKQYNLTAELVEKEAQGLERLYRLALYFRDERLVKKVKDTIFNYCSVVISENFQNLGQGERSMPASRAFREMAAVIRDIKLNDQRDHTIFDHMASHYGQLSLVRAERLLQSLVRLPKLLRAFLYIASVLALVVFIVMPFENILYSLLTVGILAFILGMLFRLVEGLNNPFWGTWRITPEPFERTMRHIEEDF